MVLKFYTSVAKLLKLKVRKFWELNTTFPEVTGENRVKHDRKWSFDVNCNEITVLNLHAEMICIIKPISRIKIFLLQSNLPDIPFCSYRS